MICRLNPVTDVQRDDTARKIVIAALLEARIVHHLQQRFLVWMHANGLRKVLITRCIVRYQPAKKRQYFE